MSGERAPAILTLEPLIEAVREGVEEAGWELSGLQKTTSHQFEGRWKGEATRSAYLFFHLAGTDEDDDACSVDVYLDETTQGLTGNLALVVDLVDAGRLGGAEVVLGELGALAARLMPPGYSVPVSLRLRLPGRGAAPASAETEVRFKLRIPRRAIDGGRDEVRKLARTAIAAFERIREAPELRRLVRG
ncbi:MAG TPA: hypothetical protein VFQ22_14150 [Longimicrobiales bacterium]|nr:hypothetical protein [Longimicrobiales bacterium]